MICSVCGRTVDASAQFCSGCGQPLTVYRSRPMVDSLYRPRDGRMIAGVCAGFAQRYGWDLALTRIVVLLIVIFTGVGAIAYLVAWIAMPNGPYSLPMPVGFQAAPTNGAPVAPTGTPGGTQPGAGPGSMAV